MIEIKLFFIKPDIYIYHDFAGFANEFYLGKGDLVFTHEFIYEPFMKSLNLECDYMFQEKYGVGEPSDTMIDSIINDLGDKKYKRIVAVGGGTVIDIAKLLVLEGAKSVIDMFERKVPLVKGRELVIVPTTCGTGSEVTNLSIVELKQKHTKMGLGLDEMYADKTVLIPELIKGLPYKFFVFSSVDALIHAAESYVSPKNNCYTELFSVSAINTILNGYLKIAEKGEAFRNEIIEDFLIASNYAGIAFSNTGVGAVHALSYPLGGNYHVAHGEANYQFFVEVLKNYNRIKPDGKIKELNKILCNALHVKDAQNVYTALENLLNRLVQKRKLREYGMKEEDIEGFTQSVIEKQQRLLVNNYTPLSKEDILDIYRCLY